MKFYWDPKEQSARRHPVNMRSTTILVHLILEVQTCKHQNKHLYPWFNAVINYEYSFWWLNSYAHELVLMVYCDRLPSQNHRYHSKNWNDCDIFPYMFIASYQIQCILIGEYPSWQQNLNSVRLSGGSNGTRKRKGY